MTLSDNGVDRSQTAGCLVPATLHAPALGYAERWGRCEYEGSQAGLPE